jgi:hypothetical protein
MLIKYIQSDSDFHWDQDGHLNAVEVIYAETVCKMKISENKLANTLKTLNFRK